METLTLSSPMVIVMVGLPGAGKSFFAEAFAKTFGAALVSQDKIRWTLFARHTYSENENIMVEQVSDLLTSELFRTGKTFILDGGYNMRNVRESVARQAKKSGYNVLTVIVQTDEPTSKHRATKRDGRKTGDQYKQSMTAEEFDVQAKNYQAPHIDKNAVVISGKHTYATQARSVLKKMVEVQGTGSHPTAATRPQSARSRGPFIQ